MTKKDTKIAFNICLISLTIAITMFFLMPSVIQAKRIVPLNPEQMEMVAEKKAWFKAKGIIQPDQPNPLTLDELSITPSQPLTRFSTKIKFNKKDAENNLIKAKNLQHNEIDRWNTENKDQISKIDIEKIKKNIDDNFIKELDKIRTMPDGEIDLPSMEIGVHSISTASFTYDSSYAQKDPLNVVFYRWASAGNVDYVLRNWASTLYGSAVIGGNQQVYIYDASHTGGSNGWKNPQDSQLSTPSFWNGSLYDRDHIRIWEGFVKDSHTGILPRGDGSYGYWSVVGAHKDIASCSNVYDYTCWDMALAGGMGLGIDW